VYELLQSWWDYLCDLFRPWYAKSEFLEKVGKQAVTCDELAEYLFIANGKRGGVLHIDAGTRTLRIPEASEVTDSFTFHEVYTDGKYVFDPRYKPEPILRAEYEALIRELNPDVSITFKVPST
jgi:hypothetical protein